MELDKHIFQEQEQTVVLGEVAKLKQAQAAEVQLPLRVKEMMEEAQLGIYQAVAVAAQALRALTQVDILLQETVVTD